jgi:predicted thioredoxin/glutaredoxin
MEARTMSSPIPTPKSRKESTMHLDIYITTVCTNCGEALLIAERARTIAGLKVAVINLDQPGQRIPPHIVAVPTYVLDGNVVSLGNPEREKFLSMLRTELQQQIKEEAR